MTSCLPRDRAGRPGFPYRGAVWAAALLVALAAPLRAGVPRDDLLRFVPDDVGFCLVVQDLRGHTADLLSSPFAEQFRRSPAGLSLAGSREVEHLTRVEGELKEHLGLTWVKLRDDVLGDAVVFAYRPGPPGKPEQEQGLVLVRARNDKVLADLVGRLDRLQKKTGELKELEEREHRGVKYYRRVEVREVRALPRPGAKATTRVERKEGYYCVRGPVLIYSGQEEMLRQAIDRDRTAGAGAEPGVTRRLRELGADRALLAIWLNPRAFDAEVGAKVDQAGPAQAPVLKTFAVYWRALDGVALFVALDKDVSLSLAVRARTEELPSAARRFLASASKSGDLWRAFPEGALVVVAGRVDAVALFEVLGSFLTRDSREALAGQLDRTVGAALGKDFVKDVLPALGPDWGLCVLAPAPQDKNWFPQAIVALRVAVGDETAPVDQALLSALNSWALLAVLGHNRHSPGKPIAIKTAQVDKREVKYLAGEGGLAPGLQPAFGLHSGFLVLATSLEAVRRFSPAAPAEAPAADAGVPILRVSFKGWRAYLAARREALAGALAGKDGLTREEAGRRLDRLSAGLQLLDRLEVRQRTAPGQVTWTLSLKTSQPLKK